MFCYKLTCSNIFLYSFKVAALLQISGFLNNLSKLYMDAVMFVNHIVASVLRHRRTKLSNAQFLVKEHISSSK